LRFDDYAGGLDTCATVLNILSEIFGYIYISHLNAYEVELFFRFLNRFQQLLHFQNKNANILFMSKAESVCFSKRSGLIFLLANQFIASETNNRITLSE